MKTLTLYSCMLLAIACAMPATEALAGRRDIPTYERDDSDRVDPFVKRTGPDFLPEVYRLGDLGILLTTYDRESLYLAYRALRLGREALAQQAEAAKAPGQEPKPDDGIGAWMASRRLVTTRQPAVVPADFLAFRNGRIGGFSNCTQGAFALAAETLKSLAGNPQFAKTDVQEWLDAQDMVFSLCTEIPAGTIPLPGPTRSTASPHLRQLREYQVAAAYFYSGQYDEALRQFDAIAAQRGHPMRGWAAHAALRSILRKASLDDSLARKLSELRSGPQTVEHKRSVAAAAWLADNRRVEDARAQIAARVSVIQADPDLASMHKTAGSLLDQATIMLTPDRVYVDLTATLDRFDGDLSESGELAKWSHLGDRLFDGGWHQDLADILRRKYEFFDWIRTIQGCTDNTASPNFQGRCEQEQAHAREQWKASRKNTWLLATLITAPKYTPTLDAAMKAARQIAPEAIEYSSVRYHMVRLFRSAGRLDAARQVLDESRLLLPSASARNLFAQEYLALARNEAEALPHLMRTNFRLAADGDELLNRRLSSDDLLRLAGNGTLPAELRKQLLLAAWWRGDLLNYRDIAQNAARQLATAMPSLRQSVIAYLDATDTDERHLILGNAALRYRISPVLGRVPIRELGAKRKALSADWWCSFDSTDQAGAKRVQRIPGSLPNLAGDPTRVSKELQALNNLGTSADWLARLALARAKSAPQTPGLRSMLKAVVDSVAMECISPQSEDLVAAARQALAELPAPAPVTEAELRAEYNRIRAAVGKHEYRVSHIMLETQAEATAVSTELQNGANFEELARRRSIDPGSRNKGGDLGWNFPVNFDEPFAAALAATQAPQLLTTPVRTRFGWHVIRIRSVRDFEPPPFEKARPGLEEKLRKSREE